MEDMGRVSLSLVSMGAAGGAWEVDGQPTDANGFMGLRQHRFLLGEMVRRQEMEKHIFTRISSIGSVAANLFSFASFALALFVFLQNRRLSCQ